jgi:hypothetical protein
MIATTEIPSAWEHYVKTISGNSARVWPSKYLANSGANVQFKRIYQNVYFDGMGNTIAINGAGSVYGFAASDMSGNKTTGTVNGVSGICRFTPNSSGNPFEISAIYSSNANPNNGHAYLTCLNTDMNGSAWKKPNFNGTNLGLIGDNASMPFEGPANALKSSWKQKNNISSFGQPSESGYIYPMPALVVRDGGMGDSFYLQIQIYIWGHQE